MGEVVNGNWTEFMGYRPGHAFKFKKTGQTFQIQQIEWVTLPGEATFVIKFMDGQVQRWTAKGFSKLLRRGWRRI